MGERVGGGGVPPFQKLRNNYSDSHDLGLLLCIIYYHNYANVWFDELDRLAAAGHFYALYSNIEISVIDAEFPVLQYFVLSKSLIQSMIEHVSVTCELFTFYTIVQ